MTFSSLIVWWFYYISEMTFNLFFLMTYWWWYGLDPFITQLDDDFCIYNIRTVNNKNLNLQKILWRYLIFHAFPSVQLLGVPLPRLLTIIQVFIWYLYTKFKILSNLERSGNFSTLCSRVFRLLIVFIKICTKM